MRLEEAHEVCRQVTREHARNFYYGFVTLPHERRRGIYAAYAFSRRCDDSVDGDDPVEAKLAAVADRRAELAACYAGEVGEDPVLTALSDTVHRFGVPREHLEALVDGIEMDLTWRRYPDWAALEGYCDRVAGAVGLVSLHVFGFSDRAAPEHARDLGVALQVVNIMRDVAEDAARDRIYLPQDRLAAHGVAEADVLAGRATPAFRAMMGELGGVARQFLARGERLLPLLDRRARMCVATLASLYEEILVRIEARDYDVFAERVHLSTPRKLTLMGRSALAGLAGR